MCLFFFFDETKNFFKETLFLLKFGLRRGEFIGEFCLVWTYLFQARPQVLDTFRHGVVIIGVPAKKFAVLGIFRALPEGVETSWAV